MIKTTRNITWWEDTPFKVRLKSIQDEFPDLLIFNFSVGYYGTDKYPSEYKDKLFVNARGAKGDAVVFLDK